MGSAVFAWLTIVTDRQTDRPTDHATPSITIGRIYVRSRPTAMRPNNVQRTTQSDKHVIQLLRCRKAVASTYINLDK